MILFVLFLFFPVAALADSDPRNTVEQLLGAIGKIKPGDGLTPEQNKSNRVYSAKALAMMDLEEVSRKALGKFWKERTDKEKKGFAGLLSQLFVHVAFPNSSKFFAELEVVYGKPRVKKTIMVVPCTVIHEKEGEVGIDFHLIKKSEQWRVTDVLLDEVSMRNNLRSQFYKVILKHDFKELFRRMEKKLMEAKS